MPIPKVRLLFTINSVVLPPIVIGQFVWSLLHATSSQLRRSGPARSHRQERSNAWAMLGGINSVITYGQDEHQHREPSGPSALRPHADGANMVAAHRAAHRQHAVRDARHLRYEHDLRRAGDAVVALGFVFFILGSDLGANVILWGAATAVLFPRYFNIRRGMYISSWAATADIFPGPFVGIFLTDYLVCRRGNVHVADLYTLGGRYLYRHEAHWRAAVAYVVARGPSYPRVRADVRRAYAPSLVADIPGQLAAHVYA
ncbi:Uu.00g050190.m01.CDS01 [Anthostomella pinea]|uniref:Uu.00g050190.m01.CDS01 n=1 Tax=Anthostomella pinea TaxID=933095 RepID=A0AAI8VSJ3_9PEZI|nr:Uu.00g050190.m01.CDS01 [Anthostomella pinea]